MAYTAMNDQEHASFLQSIASRIREAGSDNVKLNTLADDLQRQAYPDGPSPRVLVTGQAQAEVPRYVLKDDPNAPKGVPVVKDETKSDAVAKGDLRPGINDLNLAAEQNALANKPADEPIADERDNTSVDLSRVSA